MTTTKTTCLDDVVLLIPQKMASKYARAGRSQGLDYDELLSEAGLAFTEALAAWDEDRAPGGKEALGPYLVQRVEWKLRNVIWPSDRQGGRSVYRQRRGLSLDAADMPESISLLASHGRCCPGLAALEAQGEEESALEAILEVLPPVIRPVIRLLASGLAQHEVAQSLGLTTRRVRDVVSEARQRIDRARAMAGRKPLGRCG